MLIAVDRFRKASESIVRLISRVLSKEHYTYDLPYSGKSIVIMDKQPVCGGTRIYIRTTYTENGFIADISSIELDEPIRNKGIFTKIIEELKKSRSIYGIWVSNVITDEMQNACIKLGMQANNRISGYELIL